VEINGIAHIILTTADFPRARAFYGKLLPFLGLLPLVDSDEYYYCIGGRTGIGIRPGDALHKKSERFSQERVGLHHFCFRARSREDVDALHALLLALEAKIVHAPEDGPWAPGYYSVLFEDPDGIRIELNYVPGAGHLDALRQGQPPQRGGA
jgi:catechol 2,3-dioxygenase-like lactoylglutathione lyase family enzyme